MVNEFARTKRGASTVEQMIRMSNAQQLTACPFCGEPVEYDLNLGFVTYNYKPGNAVAIYCSKCPADMTLCHEDFPQHSPEELFAMLVERWNRRPI